MHVFFLNQKRNRKLCSVDWLQIEAFNTVVFLLAFLWLEHQLFLFTYYSLLPNWIHFNIHVTVYLQYESHDIIYLSHGILFVPWDLVKILWDNAESHGIMLIIMIIWIQIAKERYSLELWNLVLSKFHVVPHNLVIFMTLYL